MEEEQDIQSDIVKRDQLLDSQKNKEFDDAVAGGELEDLREGVKIRQREKSEVKSDLLKSIGFEVGANLVLDKATNWLLGAPLPGSRFIYGGANFLGSAGINLYAQKMRGEEGIKWGEAGASGVTSLVPYMNPAAGKYTKYVGKPWSIQRGAVGGAATGLVHEGIRIGADEQRLPTIEETALGASVGGLVGGGVTTAAVTGKKLLEQIQGVMPMGKLAYGVGAGEAPLSSTSRWKKFGYPEGTEPSQVQTKGNTHRNDYTPSEKALVEDELEKFYIKVQSWEASGKKSEKYPLYWVNPVTNDMYRAGKRAGILEGRRLTLQSKNRYIRSKVQSSKEQKKAVGTTQKEINAQNRKLKKYYIELRNELLNVLDYYDELIPFALPRLSGKPGSDKYRQGKAIIDRINEHTRLRQQTAQDLEDLVKGRYGLYGEHGYNVNNERIQRIVNSPSFAGYGKISLGDATNFHPVVNVDGFKSFKNILEEILNEVKPKTTMYNYPDYVLNYNPNLYPAPASFSKEHLDHILRIERISSLHMGDKKGTFGEVLLGDVVRLDGFPDGIPYNQIPENVKRGNKKTIREWLAKIGITPSPDPSVTRQTKKVIPQTPPKKK